METIKALGLNFIFGTLQHPRRHLVAGGSCSIRSMKIVQLTHYYFLSSFLFSMSSRLHLKKAAADLLFARS
ncbi:hypothetical protein T03_3875 [Trichinella britovi]|uniref:Uncharacterized protein n=1 Tax=Trichinella britovi TaxID=45882 RepID=A0A0V1DA68_TRIBR|nr:hypothetical protein T03_3875 [Trichinella britovi]